MLFLELILYDGAIEDTLKAVEQFKFAHNCIVIIESLSYN